MLQIPTVFKGQKNVIIKNSSWSQTPWFGSQLRQSFHFPVPGFFSAAKWHELAYLPGPEASLQPYDALIAVKH